MIAPEVTTATTAPKVQIFIRHQPRQAWAMTFLRITR